MIRICNLSGQITLEDNDFWFAFFDTITDKFLSFDGTPIWENWKDFETDYKTYYGEAKSKSRPIERFKSLYEGIVKSK